MNKHQQLENDRALRRFSRGDGVRLSDGRTGTVSECQFSLSEGVGYLITVPGNPDRVYMADSALESVPELNQGKYGGPSRGGAAGGWCGGSGYH